MRLATDSSPGIPLTTLTGFLEPAVDSSSSRLRRALRDSGDSPRSRCRRIRPPSAGETRRRLVSVKAHWATAPAQRLRSEAGMVRSESRKASSDWVWRARPHVQPPGRRRQALAKP